MPVYKDKQRGTYYVSCYSKITHKKKTKRGFKTKKAAVAWENDFRYQRKHMANKECNYKFLDSALFRRYAIRQYYT